jgi:hypothetical protein
MRNRAKKFGGAAAALVALALGGSAIASATQHARSASKPAAARSLAPEPTGASDGDSVQVGDQTSPDTAGTASAHSASTAPETGTETESSAASDGPGGHEDPEGDVEHQSEGQE